LDVGTTFPVARRAAGPDVEWPCLLVGGATELGAGPTLAPRPKLVNFFPSDLAVAIAICPTEGISDPAGRLVRHVSDCHAAVLVGIESFEESAALGRPGAILSGHSGWS
jgi:hypothetical protein